MTVVQSICEVGPAMSDLVGSECGSETLYEDAPWARLVVVHYACADCWWLMTSEHTTSDDVSAMFALIPGTLCYERSEPGKPFGRQANEGKIHYFWTYGKGPQIATNSAKKVIFTAKILG